MKRVWVCRDIEAPPSAVWALLTSPESWPLWGPTVRKARIEGERLQNGTRGTVTTVLGFDLPFEITDYDDGERWAWKVAGVAATDHTVHAIGDGRSRVGFGVPWPAAPYLAVCRVALNRLESISDREQVAG